MQQTNKNARGWWYAILVIVVLLVVVFAARSCRDEYGGTVPQFSDTLSDTAPVVPLPDEPDATPSGASGRTDTVDTGTAEPEVIVPAMGSGAGPAVTP